MPNSSIKEILIQPNSYGKRGRWITKILEYDLEIKPTKLVKGKGLEKSLNERNYRALGINAIMDNSVSNDGMSTKEMDL